MTGKKYYSKVMNIPLHNLGFGEFFERDCSEKQIDLDSVARVMTEHKGLYRIKNSGGEYSAKVTGKQMFEAESREDFPAVGDWVTANLDSEPAIIQEILPRKSLLRKSVQTRKSFGQAKEQLIAANIDIALVVESVDRDFNLNRFERYFAIASAGQVTPAIILNKTDLVSPDKLAAMISDIKNRFPDITVIATSTTTDSGLDQLIHFIQSGKTYCFLGSSGVGKSTLINTLTGREVAKTGAIGESTDRGKHTTTRREIFFLDNGGIVIDNPGMREVGLADSSEGVIKVFNEIADLALECKFPDCTHIHEPGCAVLAAVQSGRVDEEQYENYLRLNKEVAHYEMSDYEKHDKDRRFGKFVKKSLEKLDKYQ